MVVSVAKRVAVAPPSEAEPAHPSHVEPQASSEGERAPARAGEPTPCEQELRALIAAHLPVLKARARELCRGHVDAEDVVHDAIVRALKTRHPLRDIGRARAWLLAIVYSSFADQLRRQRRRKAVALEAEPADVAAVEPIEPLPWHAIGDEDVRAAIALLTQDIQATYRMFALEGRSYAEIAARMKIAQATVGTRIHRARRQLRSLLAAQLEKTS